MTEKERRKHTRAKLRQIAQASQQDAESTQHELMASTKDVSEGGVRLEARGAFEIGSDIQVTFAMGEEILEAKGNVANFTIQEDGTVSMGVRFSDLSEDSRKLIEEYCKKKLSEQTER
ncbi:MAG: PilZ domain-containing protein [Planctomycetes bacterium]|nr:PilZ domain-containing protein [Planctomycetota bacterium]